MNDTHLVPNKKERLAMSIDSMPKERPDPIENSKVLFIERFGAIYEHSPWVAEAAWESMDSKDRNDIDQLKSAMQRAVDEASDEAKLLLIRQHPDLADPAAKSGKLSHMSNREQKDAGLTSASNEEAERFVELNSAYKTKFGFPFVIAVKGLNRHDILTAFERRLQNERTEELSQALIQIHRIAGFRLAEVFNNNADTTTP